MSFVQDSQVTDHNVCVGCDRQCKLGARYYYVIAGDVTCDPERGCCRQTCGYKLGRCGRGNRFFWPTIDKEVIRKYKNKDGVETSTIKCAETQEQAIKLAGEIAKSCSRYKIR